MEKTRQINRICSECHKSQIKQDYIHEEQYCQNCGLVLQAPKVQGIITPGYALHIQVYTTLINTPVLVSETIITPEQLEKQELMEYEILYPPVSEESKL